MIKFALIEINLIKKGKIKVLNLKSMGLKLFEQPTKSNVNTFYSTLAMSLHVYMVRINFSCLLLNMYKIIFVPQTENSTEMVSTDQKDKDIHLCMGYVLEIKLNLCMRKPNNLHVREQRLRSAVQ